MCLAMLCTCTVPIVKTKMHIDQNLSKSFFIKEKTFQINKTLLLLYWLKLTQLQ